MSTKTRRTTDAGTKRARRGTRQEIQARYESIARTYQYIPADEVAAELVGCHRVTTRRARIALGDKFEFAANGHGWNVTPKPEPEPAPEPPNLLEKLKAKLSELSQEDLGALDSLLK